MGKLLLNEQDVKRIIGGETDLITRRVNEVEINSKDEIRLAVNKIHLDLQNYERERLKEKKEINDVITNLTEKIRELEKQKNDISERDTGNSEIGESQINDILDIRSLCRDVNISGFDQTKAKYFLYENGIYDMRINEFRDAYFLKKDFHENVSKELIEYIHTNGKKITFSKDIVNYLLNRKADILASMARYEAKKKQYKISRKNVATKQVQNYREEVKSICGTDSYVKWVPMYKIFAKTFPNFFDAYDKYIEQYYAGDKKEFSKVRYVVEIMQQGNLLLKIACELYVN